MHTGPPRCIVVLVQWLILKDGLADKVHMGVHGKQ